MPDLYVVRRMQKMDLSLLYVYGNRAEGRQRAINIDSWVADQFPFNARTKRKHPVRIRHVDTKRIETIELQLGQTQKNVRLEGNMIRGEGYSAYAADDLALLKASENGGLTLAFVNASSRDSKLRSFLTDDSKVRWQRNIGVVRQSERVKLELLLSEYDSDLFFRDEVDQLDSPTTPEVRDSVRRRMSPETFERIQRARQENGAAGELFALEQERQRLRDAGRHDLAAKIQHISLQDAMSPFDISSYEAENPPRPRFIEVKATAADGMSFEMSAQEWEFASRQGTQHYVYRVTQVRSAAPRLTAIPDITGAGQAAKVTRIPTSYRVTYQDSRE